MSKETDEPPGRTGQKDDWQWQFKNRLKTKEEIEKIINLTEDEKSGFDAKFPVAITPYIINLMDKNDSNCPIRKQFIPSGNETKISQIEMEDPCGEDHHSPVPGLVHRYPDRVLFLASPTCASYCRFCTRSRVVGQEKIDFEQTTNKKLEYIKTHTEVRDVLISGGDPLLLSEKKLEYLLKNIRAIPHVEIIRIGTRVPIVLPQRVTKKLCRMLKKYHPLLMSIHVNNVKELTEEVKKATAMLIDAGVPLGSQTVLLKGINDSSEEMKKLVHKLISFRIRPYYAYQCDPIPGSEHLRTSVSIGRKIFSELRGKTTGYCIPTYVIDAPGGGGKVPVEPTYVIEENSSTIKLKNWENKIYEYKEPQMTK